MKLFVKLMLALLVIGLLLPFTLLKDDSGKPLASFSSFSLPDFSLPDLPQIESGGGGGAATSESLDGMVLIYKWYDSEGNVQFTSEPPAQGVDYVVKGFDPEANVIQAVKMPTGESAGAGEESTGGGPNPDEIGNPYSQETIEKLFENAKNVEKLLQERFRQQDSALNQ